MLIFLGYPLAVNTATGRTTFGQAGSQDRTVRLCDMKTTEIIDIFGCGPYDRLSIKP
jgi:hypothetical protein